MRESTSVFWALEGAYELARNRSSWKRKNFASAFDTTNRENSNTGVINVPPVLGIVLLRDIVPLVGLLQFPESMRDSSSDPSGKQATLPGARLEVASWSGCLDWRIPKRALVVNMEGEVVPLIRGAPVKAPPPFLVWHD